MQSEKEIMRYTIDPVEDELELYSSLSEAIDRAKEILKKKKYYEKVVL